MRITKSKANEIREVKSRITVMKKSPEEVISKFDTEETGIISQLKLFSLRNTERRIKKN